MKVSLVINTKNEEKNIRKCILSAKKYVDEVVVMDMQSKDRTREISKKNGAKVFLSKDYGYVEPARNLAINKATGPWILLLDADETISSTLIKSLRKIIIGNKNIVGIEIPEKNVIFKKWIKNTGWWPDYHIRFFRKDSVTWSSKIHSTPVIKGKIYRLPAVEKYAILHNHSENIDDFLKRMYIYSKYEINKNTSFHKLYTEFKSEFTNRFVSSKGYLDGTHGFMLAKLMEFYRFLILLRYWENTNYSRLSLDHIQIYKFNKSNSKKIMDFKRIIKNIFNNLLKFSQ